MKLIIGVVIGIILMFILFEIKRSCLLGFDDKFTVMIKILVRQAARWSTAAKQDKNSLIAVLHANYGAGYLWALKDIATKEQIEKAAGIDLIQFQKEIVTIQDKKTKQMAKLCPKYAPPKTYLTSLGGEGE